MTVFSWLFAAAAGLLLLPEAAAAQDVPPPGGPAPLDFTLVFEHDVRFTPLSPGDGAFRIAGGSGWVRTRGIFGDFSISLEVKLDSATTEAGLGIRTLNVEGEWPRKGYRLRLAAAGVAMEARGFRLAAAVSGMPSIPLQPGTWHRVDVTANGRRVTVAVDGREIGTFDMESLAGSLVFDARRGAAEFRRVRITRLANAALPTRAHKANPDFAAARVKTEYRPSYTRGAMKRVIQGIVGLDAVVLRDGRIGDVRITRWLDPELEHAALAALRRWRFETATVKGEPVDSIVELEMTFTLR